MNAITSAYPLTLALPAGLDPAALPDLAALAEAYNAGMSYLGTDRHKVAGWVDVILRAIPPVFMQAVGLEQSFDLYRKADLRGLEMWRAEAPEKRDLIAPDKGRLVAWLLDRLDAAEVNSRRLADQLDEASAHHAARTTELLEANNREVERRRTAEREVIELRDSYERLRQFSRAADVVAHAGYEGYRKLHARVAELEAERDELKAAVDLAGPFAVEAHAERMALLERWVPRAVDAEAERDLLLVRVAELEGEVAALRRKTADMVLTLSGQVRGLANAIGSSLPTVEDLSDLANAPKIPLEEALARIVFAALDHPEKEVRQAAATVPLTLDEGRWVVALPSGGPEVQRLKDALGNFANPTNWHDSPGCLQWIGKRHAVEFAGSVLAETGRSGFTCHARSGSTGANDPQECDWPVCGCDPQAAKVLEALEERGVMMQSRQDWRAAAERLSALLSGFRWRVCESEVLRDPKLAGEARSILQALADLKPVDLLAKLEERVAGAPAVEVLVKTGVLRTREEIEDARAEWGCSTCAHQPVSENSVPQVCALCSVRSNWAPRAGGPEVVNTSVEG
ncbi:hypothetical protein [Azospirillum sp.]|uniref:hypothetical protein n=1 Tax=Azospirillum sp. TaxID=34012 RepID=UPI003D739FA2